MKKIISGIKEEYRCKSKIVSVVYLILSFLIIVCLIREIILGDIKHIVTSIVTLILFLIPSIIHMKFKIAFASVLEIMIYILIFASQILGEVLAFYLHFKMFDAIIHLLAGFIMAGIGFSLVNVSSMKNKFMITSRYLLLFSFCFGMTTGAIWEIFEYGMDKLFRQDMQKDTIINEISSYIINDENDNVPRRMDINSALINGEDYIKKYGGYIDIGLNDTMKDLIINLVGVILFLIFGSAYVDGKSKFADNFMIRRDSN